ncbi:MAG: hypothetical protein HN403_00370 [Rhodospirillales bacterium]|nr:hypothetical protein [Rhodospirillales bacterium]
MGSRRPGSLTVLIVAAMLVAACGTSKPPKGAVSVEPGAQADTPAPAKIEEKPKQPTSAEPAIDPPKPSPPEVAATPPRVDLPEPEELIGLSQRKVEDLLGAPVFRRRDPPAQLWQYSSPRCIFDLFLYRTKALPEYRVTHVEARGRTNGNIPLRECFHSLAFKQKS